MLKQRSVVEKKVRSKIKPETEQLSFIFANQPLLRRQHIYYNNLDSVFLI